MPEAATVVEVIRAPHRAAALLHPARLRILELLDTPNSAAGLARLLELPRQRVNYHLRELELEGLVELVEERRKGNCMERVVRATAQTYLISPEALGGVGADPGKVRDRFSWAYLVAVAARAIRDLGILRSRADRAQQKLATFTLETEVVFATAADRDAFAAELSASVARLASKYHNEAAPHGRRFRFFLGAYPAITKDEEGHPLPVKGTHEP
ncbi:MAG TPA: helix-turn-helix domain-containing protein [bacterium]|nr:helix-turn-helix domain-containing protein [bacterium]